MTKLNELIEDYKLNQEVLGSGESIPLSIRA